MNDQRKTKGNWIVKKLILFIRFVIMKLVWEPKYWRKRVNDVLTCPDIKFIPTVEDAGKVTNGYLIMYNGLRIDPLSYYGSLMLKMFKKSKGIHEPQEERVFLEVLKVIPLGGVMVELGSYWSFYSMCFNKAVTNATNFLVEPTSDGLKYGEKNFSINNMKGDFTRAYIGKASGAAADGVAMISVDDFIKQKQITFIDILHADIQEYEVEMLEGGEIALTKKMIGYIFISTHSNKLHYKCVEILEAHSYIILQSVNLDETYSLDGLIVAVSPYYPKIDNINLSKKSKSGKNFSDFKFTL